MSRLAFLAPVLATAALAACAQPQPAPESTAGCNAQAAQFAVGYAWTEALGEEARKRSGARTVRALRPGQAVTLEFNAERLNLDVDEGSRVTRVRCG